MLVMKKNRFKFWLCVFFVFCGSCAEAQTTKEYMTNHIEYTQGNYLPYDCMVRDMPKTTKPPKSYKSFYISHYGRHGSRFHYSSKDYRDLCDKFLKADSANALTPLGKSVKERFSKMNELYGDRAGDLTDKGAEQHRGIARRMMKSYPSVFKKNAYVDAKSSTTVRCVLSMDAFCQELKAENPKLRIHNESSKRLMCYLANDPTRDRDERLNDEAWSKAYGDLHYRLVHPSRMIGILFSDPAYVGENIDTIAFMRKFYEMKNSLASEDSDMNFDDVWTNEELYDNWVVQNAWWYGAYGPCPLTQNKSRFFANDLLKKIEGVNENEKEEENDDDEDIENYLKNLENK